MTDTTASEPVTASGGFCAPDAPSYDIFRLSGVPSDPAKLVDYWRSDLTFMGFGPRLPPRRKPIERYRAKLDRRFQEQRRIALTKAIEDLETCLAGGSKSFSSMEALPTFQAPRGTLRYLSPIFEDDDV